jgi:hypothetical protein
MSTPTEYTEAIMCHYWKVPREITLPPTTCTAPACKTIVTGSETQLLVNFGEKFEMELPV